MKKKSFVFTIVFTALTMSILSQTPLDGFYPKKGDLSLALSYTNSSYDDFYAGNALTDGNPAGFGEVSSSIYSFYTSYGINNWISTVVTLPYISIQNESGALDPIQNVNEINNIQDLSLYLKAKALEINGVHGNTFSLGIAGGVSLPISDYDARGVLSIGNQATSIHGIGILQYRASYGLFSELQLGYSLRNNSDFDIPNAILSNLKIGYFCKYFYSHAKIGIQNSQSGFDIGSPAFVAAGGAAALPETDVDYTDLDLTLCVPVYKSFSASLSYIETLHGRNFGNSSSYSLGLIYKN